MNVARTPPGQDRVQDRAEDALKAEYRVWRRLLHKAKDHRVKVLHALAREDNSEAAAILGEPARVAGAVRCRTCDGCRLMELEKVCGTCRGCLSRGGCEEHHRRCRDWDRKMCTDHAGSSVTAVSSQFDLMTADLSSYQAVINQLREVDMELDDVMDQISPDSESRRNPRFAKTARERDLDDESHHFGKLSAMLQSHGEQQARLAEVTEEGDAVDEFEPGDGPRDFVPALSATATHRELVNMFDQQDSNEQALETTEMVTTQVTPETKSESSTDGVDQANSASVDSVLGGPRDLRSPSLVDGSPPRPVGDVFPGWQPPGGAHSTLQTQLSPPEVQVREGNADSPAGRDPPSTARIIVKTLKDAQDVCAKRKLNLEAKKLDKCPLCKKQHTFEKTWSQVSPPIKTAMVSTQLASCPQFKALSPEQKLVKVTAQMACSLCTSWEHTRHKLPGGKEASEPKCKILVNGAECGGKHGKWFHPASTSQGNTGNLVTDPASDLNACQLPGLYEVYRTKF